MADIQNAASDADAPSSTPFSDPKKHESLRQTLSDAFLKGALPGENEGFDAEASKQAADFALRAMARRPSPDTVLAIESIPGQAGHRHMRLAIINDDMPFLVDSVTAELARMSIPVRLVIHPVLAVRRDGEGTLADIEESAEAVGDGVRLESVIHVEVSEQSDRI